MSKMLNKQEFVNVLAEKVDMPKKYLKAVLDANHSNH